jgi:hypothetical protein
MDVVVWNNDARNKPELEVEIELVLATAEVPGLMARIDETLEVEIEAVDELMDAWFLAEDDVVPLDDYTVYDTPPRGYAAAYALAI